MLTRDKKNCAVGMFKLTTDEHEASRGLSATAELLVFAWALQQCSACDSVRHLGFLIGSR